jgi:hypothetical protein
VTLDLKACATDLGMGDLKIAMKRFLKSGLGVNTAFPSSMWSLVSFQNVVCISVFKCLLFNHKANKRIEST